MKTLILISLIAFAYADVSHILQEDGYHYSIPNKPFPAQPPVVDIPVRAPVQQTYLPPRQPTPTPIVLPVLAPVLPVQPQVPITPFIQKPSNVQAQYLPPPVVQPIQRLPVVQPLPVQPRPQPTIAPVVIPQPTIPQPIIVPQPVAPVVIPRPQPIIPLPIVVQRPAVPLVIPRPQPLVPQVTPGRDYLPPTQVIKVQKPVISQPAIVYKPSVQPTVVVQPTPAVQIVEQPQVVYQPAPQVTHPIVEPVQVGSGSENVEHNGYVYNNTPQPPFSF